jgi:hypothetical protein
MKKLINLSVKGLMKRQDKKKIQVAHYNEILVYFLKMIIK